MEDYFATTRNGHQLVDFYDPETNTLDIRSNGLYPSNVLSNLCSNGLSALKKQVITIQLLLRWNSIVFTYNK